ncbi:hypothetical protein [Hanstruepera marina]|uniref:hypothetical protein n=1 Tax=Hanstruepera marina TaxID=2873265 RepID=UPI001CA71F8F|nr:hypothetical protein [Hanstruepera marina]
MGAKLFRKPHLYFWISIPILLLYGFLNGHGTLSVNYYDTYFIIENAYLVVILAIAFSIIGFWYWLMRKLNRKLIMWMTIIHVIITIDGIIIAFLLELFFKDSDINSIMAIIIMLIFTVQVVFPLNLMLNFLKKSK